MSILFILLGCGSKSTDSSFDEVDSNPSPVCTEALEPSCIDGLILDLSLHDDMISDATVSSSQDGDDWISGVDASAGGYQNATENPWVYVRFTDDGLERVELDDESALESMDWDMALRRFIIRLNGGDSGPSCVGAATLLESTYSEVDSIPEGLVFATDEYYSGDCTIINDSSGLPNSPQVVLGTWWEYPGCVATTGYTQLIQLANGRTMKLAVEQYYGLGQSECNQNGTPGEHSGQIQMRWQFLN
jgi:hypothetical protein